MSFLTRIVAQGKVDIVASSKTRYVNYIVLLGFGLLLTWILVLYPNVFIDIKLILALLFSPGFLLTPVFYKKLITISGYKLFIRDRWKYNVTMVFLAYLLITVPAGNFVVTSFLLTNYAFADRYKQTITLEPFNYGESYSKKSWSKYTHLDIKFDGVVKQINVGAIPADSIANKLVNVTVSKGLFGFYIIRGRRLIEAQSF